MAHLKEHDIKSLKERYSLDTFFETGTGNGEGLEHAVRVMFDRYYTCDIEQISVESACNKFPFIYPYVRPSHVAVSKFVQERTHETWNVLWWLDAHFPGVDTRIRSIDEAREMFTDIGMMPLKHELKEILESSTFHHDVIIIDDAFLYRAGIQSKANSYDIPQWCVDMAMGSIEKELHQFSATHDIEVVAGITGAFVLTPKKVAENS